MRKQRQKKEVKNIFCRTSKRKIITETQHMFAQLLGFHFRTMDEDAHV
jgi:hypothetical protein